MNQKNYICQYIHLKNNQIFLNGTLIFTAEINDSDNFEDFIKAAYKSQNSAYPKFFKMDNLSKLAFLTADILLKSLNLNEDEENNIALIFSNNSSSLDTDRKHQKSIQNRGEYFPSPAVFVYTLPNICLGEISIKHRLHSENSFFIFDAFNATPLCVYANSLLNNNKAEKVLCGWVNYDENSYEAFLYLVETKGELQHKPKTITTLYNQK